MQVRFSSRFAALIALMISCSSAHADLFKYHFHMNGPSENPSNASPATAFGVAIYDDAAHTLSLTAKFKNFLGDITQTHFHAPTATSGLPDNSPPGETLTQAAASTGTSSIAVGNPSLVGFPTGAGVRSGTYSQVINLTLNGTYNNTYRTSNGGAAGAEAAFALALGQGKTYWNIHSTFRTGGEIRGFPVLVPEPATVSIAVLGFAATILTKKLRRRI